MVKREGGGEGDASGVAVVEDDGQSAAPGGSWKRPDAVASRSQVRASGVVPSRPQPGLGEKHELCVVVGDEGVNFVLFSGLLTERALNRAMEISLARVGLVCRGIVIRLLKFTEEGILRSVWGPTGRTTGGNEINRSLFLQILATTASVYMVNKNRCQVF